MFIRGEGFNFTQGVMIDGQLPLENPEAMAGDPITAINWVNMIALAVLGQFIAWTFVQIGSANMNATVSGGLLLLSPVSTIFIAAVIYAEIPTILQVAGVILVLGAVGYQNGLHTLVMKKNDPKKFVDEDIAAGVPHDGPGAGGTAQVVDGPEDPGKHNT